MGLLEGIKVIDFTTYLAGASATKLLADWKADVIKIEPPRGEAMRMFGRVLGTPTKEDENPCFEIVNSNKKVIAVDGITAEGQEILHKLLADADIFVTNYREKALEKMGLDYETLSKKYPRLIYGFLNGYGTKGPLAKVPGFDVIAFWARGGFLGYFFNEPGTPPLAGHPGGGDMISGTCLAGGLLAALVGREKTGKGERVDASLYHSAMWAACMPHVVSHYSGNMKLSHHTPAAPLINSYMTSDGEYIVLAVMEHERYWPPIAKLAGKPELAEDENLALFKNACKPENSKRIVDILDEAFAKKTSSEWLKLLAEADIAADKVFQGTDINADEQAYANDYIKEITFANGSKTPLTTSPILFTEEGELPWRLSGGIGRDTKEVLLSLGYGEDKIAELTEKGSIK